MRLLVLIAALLFALPAAAAPGPDYYSRAGHADAWSGGTRMITIHTPRGDFRVWTKRVGNNPRLRVLLLHGGPAMTHEYFEAFDSFLSQEGIEYIYYDQLGSAYSDQPNDDSLWTIPRFVDEVEQVRVALGLTRDNFCLLGHSWGGMLAMEYALAHQDNLKCLIISNMMDSIPAYNDYARRVLMPAMDQNQLHLVQQLEASHQTQDPRYMQALVPMHYEQHFLRRPFAEWPEPVLRAIGHANQHVYELMQGPSELGASGLLVNWDRSGDLHRINVPTLVIGARYDTMDPNWMRAMAGRLPHGQFLYLPNGSHMSFYDDQDAYFAGLIRFLHGVEGGRRR
ncbi:proline iminopeptidase-family hydrolase [Allosphingosinicella sp.]|uniref:proline iminopeptidase-family hydrolase n=1 Tax=Allosphingosinicella sp. TaxID=2823234 RepID=UPI0037840EFF